MDSGTTTDGGAGIDDSSSDSGCGCHTVPTTGTSGAFAGLALLGALALRRRRSRAS